MEADRVPLRKASENVGIVNVAITSLKSVEEIWMPEWAQLSDSGSSAPCGNLESSSTAILGSSAIVLSLEHDRL